MKIDEVGDIAYLAEICAINNNATLLVTPYYYLAIFGNHCNIDLGESLVMFDSCQNFFSTIRKSSCNFFSEMLVLWIHVYYRSIYFQVNFD